MKFRLNQQDFSKALIFSGKSLLSKSNLPILSNLLITAEKGKVEILSTNLETATRVTVGGKCDREGKITISGKTLLEFVSQLPPEEVVFEVLGEEVAVTSGSFKARMVTMAAEEFPAIPKIEKGTAFKVEGFVLARCIDEVTFSAAQDEGRPILTGVLWEIEKDKLKMVATDGYRLSFDEITISGPKDFSAKIIVPSRALVEVAKIISEKAGGDERDQKTENMEITVADNQNQINFKIGEIEFTSRLIEGEYPAWQKVIPSSFASRAKISREEFVKIVRIASIFARDGGGIIKLKFEVDSKEKSRGLLTISGNAAQVGSSDSQIGVDLSGPGGEIAFNFRYLLDVLSVISADEISFEMVESLNPGKISFSEAPHFFHIIMPVRLQA